MRVALVCKPENSHRFPYVHSWATVCVCIDINCGCPQRWAYQERIGSFLMTEPELVRDMIRTVKGRVDIPCSIKIRVHRDLK